MNSLANPPFNPAASGTKFAWPRQESGFIHCIRRSLGEGGHLAPQGMAGFVLANGSMSSNQSVDGDFRRTLIEADLVDCMVALPDHPFNSRQIAVCLWFCEKNDTLVSAILPRLSDGETEFKLVA